MFISQAFAQGAGAPGGDMLVQFLPLILIFVVFYFLLIRPQQKRMKEHRAMLGALRRGDRVVTGGGIIGHIVKAGDEELTVEIAEGVRVKVLRSTVTTVLAKPEPARGGSAARDEEPDEPAVPAADRQPAQTAADQGQPGVAPERKGFGRFLSRK